MNKKLMFVVTLSSVIIVSLLSVYFMHFYRATEPSWMRLGTYMIYKQFFVWDGKSRTDHMAWNITTLKGEFVDLNLTSHGVNVTDRNVELTSGKVNLTINIVTREVTYCSDALYGGEKWPFWIETNVTTGSMVDI